MRCEKFSSNEKRFGVCEIYTKRKEWWKTLANEIRCFANWWEVRNIYSIFEKTIICCFCNQNKIIQFVKILFLVEMSLLWDEMISSGIYGELYSHINLCDLHSVTKVNHLIANIYEQWMGKFKFNWQIVIEEVCILPKLILFLDFNGFR